MNSVLLFEQDRVKDDLFVIEDDRAQHMLNHLKVAPDGRVQTTLVNQGLGQSIVSEIKKNTVFLKALAHDQRSPSPVQVSIGLSRPPTMKKILEHGTTLGVGSFSFFQAKLSEKSYSTSKVLSNNSLQELCRLGLSQSRFYAHLPKVEINSNFHLSSDVPSYFLDANASEDLLSIKANYNEPIHFLLGPERGWTDEERQQLLNQGARPLSLAPTTLRVEHALFALMGQWHLMKRNQRL